MKCISNHYRCQICHSDEYSLKYFKKENNKWLECSENDAEIEMECCADCNCDERVHENYFINQKYEEGKRPYIHNFWNHKTLKAFSEIDSENLYDEIYGE